MSTVQDVFGQAQRRPRTPATIAFALGFGAFMMGFAFAYYAALPVAVAGTIYLAALAMIA